MDYEGVCTQGCVDCVRGVVCVKVLTKGVDSLRFYEGCGLCESITDYITMRLFIGFHKGCVYVCVCVCVCVLVGKNVIFVPLPSSRYLDRRTKPPVEMDNFDPPMLRTTVLPFVAMCEDIYI